MKVIMVALLAALFGFALLVGVTPHVSGPPRQIESPARDNLPVGAAIRVVLERSQEIAIEQRRHAQAQG